MDEEEASGVCALSSNVKGKVLPRNEAGTGASSVIHPVPNVAMEVSSKVPEIGSPNRSLSFGHAAERSAGAFST